MLKWLPPDVSTYGGDVDHVIALIYYIVGVWFILTEVVFFYFLIRYRHKEGRKADYAPGNTLRAAAWILIPAALILGFDMMIDVAGGKVWDEIKQEIPAPGQEIKIMGRQFVWEFTHPGRDGKLGTADDIQTLNQLYVPVNTVVKFTLGSHDVIHSFWAPYMRLKQDAVPGRMIQGWFEVTKTGEFPMGCAQICGVGHGNMRATMHALSAEDYKEWVEKQYEEDE